MAEVIEKKLWARVERFLPVLQMIPFVKMVAVCNNLAFGKVEEDSDIDLFVVAEKGRLFFVRTFITALLHVMGVRRHGDKVQGRFCLSFFVDDAASDLFPIALKNDFYLAYWIVHLKPVIDRDNYSQEFLLKNDWINAFYDEELLISRQRILRKNPIYSFVEQIARFVFNSFIGDIIESILKKWQLVRAQKKASLADENSNLIVTENILKFHNIDRRREYNLRWEKRFGLDSKLKKEKFLSL